LKMSSGDVFRFKHHSFLYALESEMLYQLLDAIYRKCSVVLTMQKQGQMINLIPYKILISTRYGREYLLAWNLEREEAAVVRLDRIHKVKITKKVIDWERYQNQISNCFSYMWGVSPGSDAKLREKNINEKSTKDRLEHVELVICADKSEGFVVDRLRKEKRSGTIVQEGNNTWRFSAEVWDAQEMLPWIRSFTGRIISFTCSNPLVEERFRQDLAAMHAMYGIIVHEQKEATED